MWPKLAGLRDAQAVAVAARRELQRAGRRHARQRRLRPPDLLHFAQRGAPQWARLGAIARRPRVHHPRHVPREIAQRRQHPAHRAERAVGQRRLFLPLFVLPPVAVRQAAAAPPAHRASSPAGQRLEQPAADVVAVRHARHLGDDAPEDGEAVVRVLVGKSWRIRERDALPHQRRHLRRLTARAADRPRGCLRGNRRHATAGGES